MNYEKKLLAAAASSRRAHGLISKHIPSDELSELGRRILEVIEGYYDRDSEAERCDMETLTGLVLQTTSNPKHKETFEHAMKGIAAVDTSAMNLVAELLGARREAVASRLANSLLTDPHQHTDLLDEYEALMDATELGADDGPDLWVAPSIEDLTGGAPEEKLYKLFPKALNSRLNGGMRAGHHVVVFARPEAGKTAFLVNLTYGFLQQDLKVLYLCNEEPELDIVTRIQSRLSNMDTMAVAAEPREAYERALQKGYGNLAVRRLEPGSLREIEEKVSTYQPDVLIVDQLRNVKVKDDNFTRQLELAAAGVRQIAGKYKCLAVSATQAGGSADDKAVLEMGDVDSSNTGVAAQADLMIGIGASREDQMSNRRVLSLCKNKRSGRHDFFPVRIEPALSRYISVE